MAFEVIGQPVPPPPCPLMSFHDSRFWCRLIETEKAAGMEPMTKEALGVGTGCIV